MYSMSHKAESCLSQESSSRCKIFNSSPAPAKALLLCPRAWRLGHGKRRWCKEKLWKKWMPLLTDWGILTHQNGPCGYWKTKTTFHPHRSTSFHPSTQRAQSCFCSSGCEFLLCILQSLWKHEGSDSLRWSNCSLPHRPFVRPWAKVIQLSNQDKESFLLTELAKESVQQAPE